MNLNENDITIFLLSIGVMLFFARSFGELSRKFKQPLIIGEIIAGIVLGPTIFGNLFPSAFSYLFESSASSITALSGITTMAVVMLMLVTGLEIDLGLTLRQGKAASSISSLGFIFPFLVGFIIAYFAPQTMGINNPDMRFVFALFIGVALSITALPVVAKVLMDLKIFKTDVGFVIITSAMINDLIGWIIFSLILGMMGKHAHGMELHWLIITLFSFVLLTLLVGRKIINLLIPYLNKFTSFPGGVLNFIFILGFLCAAFTEYIGIHAIFGAFIIGIAIGDSTHLKEETREMIHQFVTNIFAPLFFVAIGLRVNFIDNFDLLLVSIFLILAFVGKVVGSGLGAYFGGKSFDDCMVIGFGMNARGAMEIILGLLALQSGLITEKVFVALVIMALVTSITSAPLMNIFLKRRKLKLSLEGLLKSSLVIATNKNSKKEVIKDLCDLVSKKGRLDGYKVFNEVWLREVEMSTGIINGFAVPHARLPIQKPVIGLAISKVGIEFDSMDKQVTNVIFLILIPQNEPEIQLQLIAEISKKFKTIDFTKELISLDDPELIIKKLKEQQ